MSTLLKRESTNAKHSAPKELPEKIKGDLGDEHEN
jgi:hypothetical protein